MDDGTGTEDCMGHGTHIAGTIGGNTVGVAPGVMLHPVRVNGCDGLLASDYASLVSGIDWVCANHIKPAVANISFGLSSAQPGFVPVRDAMNRLVGQFILPNGAQSCRQGISAIVSAGNDDKDACTDSPATLGQGPVTVVAASSANDARWDPPGVTGSNWGRCVDLFAPGENIRSTWISRSSNGAFILNGAWYNDENGTSFAAAHATGVAALYLEAVPWARPGDVDFFLRSNATTGVIQNSGSNSPDRLLFSRWSTQWAYYNTESCYDLIVASCYTKYWTPACPSRPVTFTACSNPGDICFSPASHEYLEEYTCVSGN